MPVTLVKRKWRGEAGRGAEKNVELNKSQSKKEKKGNSEVPGALVHTFNSWIVEAERQGDLCEFEASQNDRVKLYQNSLKGPKLHYWICIPV